MINNPSVIKTISIMSWFDWTARSPLEDPFVLPWLCCKAYHWGFDLWHSDKGTDRQRIRNRLSMSLLIGQFLCVCGRGVEKKACSPEVKIFGQERHLHTKIALSLANYGWMVDSSLSCLDIFDFHGIQYFLSTFGNTMNSVCPVLASVMSCFKFASFHLQL